MRNRIERIRIYLLAGACLLLGVLAVFIGSARYLKRHALARLTSRLGIDIKSETNGFTYSQSLQGRTLYTIHAAKEIEHRDGKITLHDVSMVLYGRTGDRADMVYGKDFEYDQSAGVLRAVGLVHIDLGAAGSGKPGAPPLKPLADGEDDPGGGPRLLHATTSGLVYLDKLGVAATSEAIEFQTGQIKGHAVGADYTTDTGLLMLHSAVTMSGTTRGRPVALCAASAQLDQRNRRTLLSHARYTSGAQTMEAAQATLYARPDNSLERIQAEGNVTLTSPSGTVSAARADVDVASGNKLHNVLLNGAVRYVQEAALRQTHADAAQANIAFDARGAAQHALFSGGVRLAERTRTTDDSRQPWSTRDLSADTLNAMFGASSTADAKAQSVLRDAEASGHARLTMVDSSASARSATTLLSGDDLTVHLLPPSSAKQHARVESVAAHGHTVLRQTAADGTEQTTESDTLNAVFKTSPSKGPTAGPTAQTPATTAAEQLASAVEEGHVRMVRHAAPGKDSSNSTGEPEEATAQHAAFDGNSNHVNLSGSVRLSNAASLLFADHVTLDRTSGNAEAEGTVKVSYVQQPAPKNSSTGVATPAAEREPVHIVADRAHLDHASDVTTFFGRPVRAWQGSSQIQAPVIELSRKQQQLTARAEVASGARAVHATLSGTERPLAPSGLATPGGSRNNSRPPGVQHTQGQPEQGSAAPLPIHIESGALVYSGVTQQAQFTGGVRITNAAQTVLAHEATAFLQSPSNFPVARSSGSAEPRPATSSTPLSLDGRIDRLVASGAVVVDQPGLHATGDTLVYTAADRLVLLTGSSSAPPRVLDTARGATVTAPAFRFHTSDQSIEALAASPGAAPETQRVLTDTPVRR